MPQGVDWTPVDQALEKLRKGLHPIVDQETVPTSQAGGRILSRDVFAQSSNPPFANSAVDGYAFAYSSLQGKDIEELPIVPEVASAGHQIDIDIPKGQAVRILTGARVPRGVDTVILDEDVQVENGFVQFRAGLKAGANTRDAGEDVRESALIFSAQRRLRATDLALLSACGVSEVPVFKPLKVGVLSTGDEVTDQPKRSHDGQIFDANRPMLLEMIRAWGFAPVDLGHAKDDAGLIETKLSEAASCCDAVLTTGGASAGDEDHVSRLLVEKGNLQSWRIAVKPGRPLALALWDGVPVFGLPGNPVAAFVCALVFGYPSLSKMSGAGWITAQPKKVPAAFSKNKKQGRREYLRARLNENGHAEVFKSEGSGRISGLSWATGLVELHDHGYEIAKGDLVNFMPFSDYRL